MYRAVEQDSLEIVASGKAYHVATKSQEQPYLLHHLDGNTHREERSPTQLADPRNGL